MKLILLSFIILALFSCGSFKKLEINEIRLAYIEYNPIEGINFGSIIDAKIMVIMNDGKEINITNNRKLNINSNDIIPINSKQFKIIKHPKLFNDNTACLDIKIKDKDYLFETKDSIKINFKGDLNINANGLDGDNGINQKHRNSPLIFRDGSNGENVKVFTRR